MGLSFEIKITVHFKTHFLFIYNPNAPLEQETLFLLQTASKDHIPCGGIWVYRRALPNYNRGLGRFGIMVCEVVILIFLFVRTSKGMIRT